MLVAGTAMPTAGAAEVHDFTDFGLVSTFQVPPDVVVRTAVAMHASLVARDVDVIVMEVADGLLCTDTVAFLDDPEVRKLVDGTVFAASDAAGALLGVRMLQDRRLRLLAVSGVLTASPLAVREAQTMLDLPVFGPAELSDPGPYLPLLRGTIADNVRYAAPDADGPQLHQAILMSGLDEVIRDLPDGLRTKVGEGGAGLSAGQRQRVALARAVLARPRVLLLDEADAHLDPTAIAVNSLRCGYSR